MTRVVHKAVCYVVQEGHLLVFTHNEVPITEVGVQVPAGSIEPGESPEAGAVRELFEETGRRGRVIRDVGTQQYDLRPSRDEIAVRHFFQMEVDDADMAERWTAGESDPSHHGAHVSWTCWWMRLANAHVLAAGLGCLLGAMLEEDVAP